MPYKDKAKQKEYQRTWMARRREAFFKDKSCVICGTKLDLELDHIDPGQKVSHNIWSWNEDRRSKELAKCQVLCETHHAEKSKTECARGESNGMAKLTEEAVREIRTSKDPVKVLAARYGVHKMNIYRAKNRASWKHI